MTPAPFRLEALGQQHERSTFHCGEDALDHYFQTQATQDIRRRIANCIVAVEAATNEVAGYYTLSAASILLGDLPAHEARKLPRYPTVPAVRIGRLAVDRRFQRRGLGEAMLADATSRAVKADIAAFALLVDAKNDHAVAFYRRYGFVLLPGDSRRLYLPIATAARLAHFRFPPGRQNAGSADDTDRRLSESLSSGEEAQAHSS